MQDPGNLESDLQAGARTGYTLAWVLMWSTVMVRAPDQTSSQYSIGSTALNMFTAK